MRIVLGRLARSVVVVWGVVTVVFVTTRVVTDPARLQLAIEASPEDYERLRQRLGLDAPTWEQYIRYLGDLFRFDFGNSFTQGRPASEVVLEALPRTLQLVAISLPLALVISIVLGTAAARRPGGVVDRAISAASLLGISVPPFLVGLILVLIFAVWLGVLPTSGVGGIDHLVLPVATLTLAGAGRLTTMVRSSMIDELNRPWIEVARAKGMTESRVLGVHALRNSSVGVVTLAGLELITMIAGYAIIVEFIFAWPGLGLAALSATTRQDLPVIQMIVLLIAVMVVVVNLLVDFIYTILDPRIRMS